MEEFEEDEFQQPKMAFIKEKLETTTSMESDWLRNYNIGKWAIRYLKMLEDSKTSKKQIEEFCYGYWNNSSVRKYYFELCIND